MRAYGIEFICLASSDKGRLYLNSQTARHDEAPNVFLVVAPKAYRTWALV